MPPSLRRELERAALFLQTDREYIDPDAGWHWSGVVLTTGLALCLIGLIGSGAGEERLPPVAVTVLKVMAAVGGVMFLGPLFLVYTLGLMMQAFHIVRVRVLRQDLGERDVERQDECWPFTTREDYLEAKARLIDEPRRA